MRIPNSHSSHRKHFPQSNEIYGVKSRVDEEACGWKPLFQHIKTDLILTVVCRVCELAANSTLASPPDESRAERKRINERMMKERSRFHY